MGFRYLHMRAHVEERAVGRVGSGRVCGDGEPLDFAYRRAGLRDLINHAEEKIAAMNSAAS